MLTSWIRPVEKIVLPALENRIRILGFTAPKSGAGVSTLCRAAAETLARSGAKVLLLDLTTTAGCAADERNAKGWVPGESGMGELVTHHADGYDVLVARPQQTTRFLFNNSRRMRLTMAEELSGYAAIVVDLPPLLDADAGLINPVAAALLCDTVLLVCAKGQSSREDIRAAVDQAKLAGVKLSGTIFNEFGAKSLADQISHSIRHRLGFVPMLAGRLERMTQTSPLLR